MNEKWIRADYRFNDRYGVFFLSRKYMLAEMVGIAALSQDGKPDELEDAVRELLLKHRPELAGCCIHYIGFKVSEGCWEIGVSHASLDRVPFHECPPRRPLDPAYEFEIVATDSGHTKLIGKAFP